MIIQVIHLTFMNPCIVIYVIMKVSNKMQLYRLIYYSRSALRVSGNVFAHHQEHLNVFTVSGNIHPSGYRLVTTLNLTFMNPCIVIQL